MLELEQTFINEWNERQLIMIFMMMLIWNMTREREREREREKYWICNVRLENLILEKAFDEECLF